MDIGLAFATQSYQKDNYHFHFFAWRPVSGGADTKGNLVTNDQRAFIAGLFNTIIQLTYLLNPAIAAGGGSNFFQGKPKLARASLKAHALVTEPPADNSQVPVFSSLIGLQSRLVLGSLRAIYRALVSGRQARSHSRCDTLGWSHGPAFAMQRPYSHSDPPLTVHLRTVQTSILILPESKAMAPPCPMAQNVRTHSLREVIFPWSQFVLIMYSGARRNELT